MNKEDNSPNSTSRNNYNAENLSTQEISYNQRQNMHSLLFSGRNSMSSYESHTSKYVTTPPQMRSPSKPKLYPSDIENENNSKNKNLNRKSYFKDPGSPRKVHGVVEQSPLFAMTYKTTDSLSPPQISPKKLKPNFDEVSKTTVKFPDTDEQKPSKLALILSKYTNSPQHQESKSIKSAKSTKTSESNAKNVSKPVIHTQIPNSATASKKKSLTKETIEEIEEPMSSRSKISADNTSITKAKTRRSSVVKEVERLKKKREERRQKQAEEKAEKEAFMSKTPGNPHWELLKMVKEYQATIDFRAISMTDLVEEHQISVCVRKRPMNKNEKNRKEIDVISVPTKNTVIVHEPKNKVDLTKYLENQTFRFDYVFDESCNNELVYKFTAQPLVMTIFEGNMATCFAYGQTGSGKTHTMGGDFHGKTQECNKGIYALVAKDVFYYTKSSKYCAMEFVIAASFFEIYSGKVFDLLNKKTRLRILEDGKQQVQVVGLTEKMVTNVDDVLKLIQLGNSCRTSGQTSVNSCSSRSHAVFQITIRPPGVSKVFGKFSLIDLAGNERGSDTSSSDRLTRMEGAEINKSLLALKECIRALGQKNHHLPFRASKLTQILRDSFIGENSKTCMIAMISPGVSSCEHTLNTLRYADRVKELEVAESDVEVKELEDNDSDLLKSITESEMNEEMKKFHKVMNALMATEEALVENHKSINDYLDQMLLNSRRLYNKANAVDYDQDVYSLEFEEMLQNGIANLQNSLKLVNEFRTKLSVEEQLSRTLKPKCTILKGNLVT